MQEKVQEIAERYLKQRSTDYYVRFWAGTALSSGLTIKTQEGKELMVKLEDISMVDLGQPVGKCMCGHAIRYEFWLGNIGPIGSSCIGTMTGLEGKDLRALLRGGELAKKDRDQFLYIVERYGTMNKQMEENQYFKEAIFWCDKKGKLPESANEFLENDIPFPWSVRKEIQDIYQQSKYEETILRDWGEEVLKAYLSYSDVVRDVELIINGKKEQLIRFIPEGKKFAHETLIDIAMKINLGNVTQRAVDHFMRVYQSISDPRFADALEVLIKLNYEDIGNFWNNIVEEYLGTILMYGLTDGKYNFVLEKTKAGKPGLAERFEDKLGVD